MSSPPAQPHVVLVHAGGLGDLVLLSELISSLKRAHPNTFLTLICRTEFAGVVDGYPDPPDKVVGLPFQPYAWTGPSPEIQAFLDTILSNLSGRAATTLVDAAIRPTWLAEYLRSALKPSVAIRCGLDDDKAPVFRNIERPAGTHERDRYHLLAKALESPFSPVLPWTLPERWKNSALNWLQNHGLERGKYLACAPFGAASTPVKRWPLESFNDVLHRFYADSRWPVLLIGDSSEDQPLAALGSLLFDLPTSRFAGRPDELPLAAGLLALSGAYLSNDSGLMHLAQAFEAPGVGIFGGGGEWPAYAPWARGSIGLCHPLPCFGCGWNCFLGHGLCVESIPVEKVYETLLAVTRSPAEQPGTVILDTVREPLLGLVADASARYRESELDRAKQNDVIVELNHARNQLMAQLTQAHESTAAMERIAAERLTVLEGVHTEAARRLDMIDEISAQAEIHRRNVEQLSAALAQREAKWWNFGRKPAGDSPRPASGSHWIVTGADEDYFASARLLIASWAQHSPSAPLLFCDFGLSPEQRAEAAAWPVRKMGLPPELVGASRRRAKAGLVHFLDAAKIQWRWVTWIDPDAVLLRAFPQMEEIADGYDLLCEAPDVAAAEAIDVAGLAALSLDPADACFDAGFWTSTSYRLLQSFDRFSEALIARGEFHERDALTAAVYATRSRVRPFAASMWQVHGGHALDTVAVDGDWIGFAGQQSYVLRADSRFVIRDDGLRLLNRDVLRGVQMRFEARYREYLESWQRQPTQAVVR